jgi:hypothetical protein
MASCIFGMTALVLRRHCASNVAAIRNLFIAGGNQLLNVLVFRSHDGPAIF